MNKTKIVKYKAMTLKEKNGIIKGSMKPTKKKDIFKVLNIRRFM